VAAAACSEVVGVLQELERAVVVLVVGTEAEVAGEVAWEVRSVVMEARWVVMEADTACASYGSQATMPKVEVEVEEVEAKVDWAEVG